MFQPPRFRSAIDPLPLPIQAALSCFSPFAFPSSFPPVLAAGQARKLRPGIFINRDPTSSALGPLLSVTPSAHPTAFNFSRLQESGHPAIEWVEPEICNIPRHCDTGIASSSKAALTHRVLGCRTSLLLCLRASNYSASYQKHPLSSWTLVSSCLLPSRVGPASVNSATVLDLLTRAPGSGSPRFES